MEQGAAGPEGSGSDGAGWQGVMSGVTLAERQACEL